MFEMYGYGSEDLERDTSGDYMVDAGVSACHAGDIGFALVEL